MITLKSFSKSFIAKTYNFYKKDILKNNQKWLFLLGHMRSGSSLLMHLLISHPDLLGIGERNSKYENINDLQILEIKSRFLHKEYFGKYKYFVDQINHNHFTTNSDLLNEYPFNLVFLIREPFSTITSIMKLSQQFYNDKWTVEKAIEYYISRLTGMQKIYYSINNKSKIKIIRYENLIDYPEQTLKAIQSSLELTIPFSTNYQLFNFTGKSGDPGDSIKQRKIVKTSKPILTFNKNQTIELQNQYLKCLNNLSSQ